MGQEDLRFRLIKLMDRTKDFSKEEKVESLLDLIQSELNLMNRTHHWSKQDLNLIKDRADRIYIETSSEEDLEGSRIHSQPQFFKTYCFAQATYEYLRSKEMTPYLINLKSAIKS